MKEIFLQQKQVLLFVAAGALSAVVEIGSFKIFSVYLPLFFAQENNFHGIHFPLSNIFSTSCGIITNYFLSIWFVFERGKHSKKKEFAYFMIVSFFSTILSLSFFQIFFRFVFNSSNVNKDCSPVLKFFKAYLLSLISLLPAITANGIFRLSA